jgi:hypothetical protein
MPLIGSVARSRMFIWQACVMTDQPPDGLPRYRVLTGPDDEMFCRRVSEALDLGFHLHGSPALMFGGGRVVVAQASVWPGNAEQ